MKIYLLSTLALLSTVMFGFAEHEKNAPERPELFGAAKGKLITVPSDGPKVFLVHSDGAIVPFKVSDETKFGSSGVGGSDDPLLSPDGQSIAMVEKGRLLIRDTNGMEQAVVVSGYLFEELMITSWSRDSQNLIFYLAPPQAEDPPPSKITRPKYQIYNVATKILREIKIGGQPCGWLRDGSMLIQNEANGSLQSFPLSSGTPVKIILKDSSWWSQISLHPSAQQIAANQSRPHQTSTSQLVKVDLATGNVTPITPVVGWADLQWPQWNPSGQKVAWVARVGTSDGIPASTIVIDGKTITKPMEIVRYDWLADNALVLVNRTAILVIDADGKELGKKNLVGAL